MMTHHDSFFDNDFAWKKHILQKKNNFLMLTLFSYVNVGKHCYPTGNTDESFKCRAHTKKAVSKAHARQVFHLI